MIASRNYPVSSYGMKFKATLLWQSLVNHLHVNVKQKRRRLILKGVGPTYCFSASDLCDSVLLFLLMDHDNFRTTDLTREKAAKLCQLLLDQHIIEPLSGSTSSLEKRFDDTSSKFYKFTASQALKSCEDDYDLKKNEEFECLPPPDDKMKICKEREPELLENVISNAATGLVADAYDADGHVLSQLLELTSADPVKSGLQSGGSLRRSLRSRAAPLTDISNRFKRSSLDCEAAMNNHGNKISRNLSSHISTPGYYKRKTSTAEMETSVYDNVCNNEHVIVRRRRASADTFTTIKDKESQETPKKRMSSTPTSKNTLPPRAPKPEKRLTSTAVNVDPGNNIDINKSVAKLAKITGELIFSPAAISDLRQEIALSQLSQLIDLPILEGLICVNTQNKDEPGYDNSVFFNVEQQRCFGLDTNDVWIRCAIEVFDHIPNGHKTTFDYSVGINPLDYKMALYKSILKNYRARTEPLLPSSHETIHLGVLSLIMGGEEQKAVLAMQLSAILLPCYLLAEAAALLEFLYCVCKSSEPKIRASHNNNDAVLNDFCGIFFMGSKLLSMDQRRILLLLMIRYHDEMARVPLCVQKSLERSIQSLKQGEDIPAPSTLFCNKLSCLQYERQSKAYTESAIISLIKKVIDDTDMSLKEKQKHIKRFQKHHPAIMAKHFHDIA